MKELYLIRHAKAIDRSLAIDDFYRSLTERGINNACVVAKKLLRRDGVPQCVISSPATRAITTAIIFCKELHFPLEEIKLNESLYESNVKCYFDAILSIPANINTLFLFAHNPRITDFANMICSDATISHIPTSGVVGVSLKSWKVIASEKGRLIVFETP